MLELTVRLIASLAVVVGLLLLLARLAGRRFAGRDGAAVQVLHRQPLSRTASVAVLSVGSRILVVGTTDQQVQLLTELEPDELESVVLDVDPGLVEVTDSLEVVTPFSREELAAPTQLTGPGRRAGVHRAPGARKAPTGRRAAGQGGLAGSVLSPDTWRQALAAASGKAS